VQDDGDIGEVVVDHAHRLALVPLLCAFGGCVGRLLERMKTDPQHACLTTTTIGTMAKGQTDHSQTRPRRVGAYKHNSAKFQGNIFNHVKANSRCVLQRVLSQNVSTNRQSMFSEQ
jgi:hypothetical protein